MKKFTQKARSHKTNNLKTRTSQTESANDDSSTTNTNTAGGQSGSGETNTNTGSNQSTKDPDSAVTPVPIIKDIRPTGDEEENPKKKR